MIRQNEIEEIVRLINSGFDINLLSFELDIPIEQLKAYVDRTNISEEELPKIESEKEEIDFSEDIDETLNEFQSQKPRRKSSNLRKKSKQESLVKQESEPPIEEETDEEEIVMPDYEEIINKYKREIEINPNKSLNKRNLLAFAYYRAGRIEEARDELLLLIEQLSSYMAYRQLIYLEKNEGNLDDAKLWAYDAMDKFPDSIDIREQLISIARIEKDDQEIIKLLKEIMDLDPNDERNKKRLETISKIEER